MPYFADSNRSILRLLPETQWGQTPTSGVSRAQRMTSHSLTTKKTTAMSNEIRDDRMVSDIIETEMMSDGSINFEFASGSSDDILEAFVCGTWSRPMTFDSWEGTEVSWIAVNEVAVSGPTIVPYLTVGRRMKTENFINLANNGFFQISAVTFNATTNQSVVTFTTSPGIIEAGNLKSRLSDANDIIVLSNTAIRAGTGGLAEFDSNGTNAFASAITAGNIVAGQKIHVEGLGYDVGSIAFSKALEAGDSVTIFDGVNTYTFVAGTDFAFGTTAAMTATNLAWAVNTARVLGIGAEPGIAATYVNVAATVSGSALTVKNFNATGGTLNKGVDAGTAMTVTAFAGGNVSEHGIFTIIAAANDVLTVSPAPATNANVGAAPVTIRGSMLRNPSVSSNIITQSYTMESGYEDVGLYFVQNGMTPSGFTLDVNASQIINGTVELMGRATTTSTATVIGAAPYTALNAVTCESMNATTDAGTVTKNGLPLTTAVKQIKMDCKAQLRNQMAVGSQFPVGMGFGRFELTGSVQAYFANFDLFNNFLNHDSVSLGFSFTDSAGQHYEFAIPAVKLTADPINAKGIDQDVMEDITFSAFRDPATACMLQVDRFSSLRPV